MTEGSQEPHHVFPLGAIVSSRSNSLAFINSTLEYNNKRNNKHYGDIIKSTANNNNKLCKINLKISPFWHLTKSWGNSEFDELNSLCVCVCSWTNFFFPHVYRDLCRPQLEPGPNQDSRDSAPWQIPESLEGGQDLNPADGQPCPSLTALSPEWL